jgi:hypothetical protein
VERFGGIVQRSDGYTCSAKVLWEIVHSSGGYKAEFWRVYCRGLVCEVQRSDAYCAEVREYLLGLMGTVQWPGGYSAEF